MTHPLKNLAALLLVAATASGCVVVREDDSDGPHATLLPLSLPTIQTLTVTTAGTDIRGEADKKKFPEAFSCDDFRVSQRDIEKFFKLTHAISQQDYLHAIDWVPCWASGNIHFADNTTAQWDIMMSGAGVVTFADGTQRFLFCRRCKKPFVPK